MQWQTTLWPSIEQRQAIIYFTRSLYGHSWRCGRFAQFYRKHRPHKIIKTLDRFWWIAAVCPINKGVLLGRVLLMMPLALSKGFNFPNKKVRRGETYHTYLLRMAWWMVASATGHIGSFKTGQNGHKSNRKICNYNYIKTWLHKSMLACPSIAQPLKESK